MPQALRSGREVPWENPAVRCWPRSGTSTSSPASARIRIFAFWRCAAARRQRVADYPHVVIPSTIAWVFASLAPAISFADRVIVSEFIGAARGIGRLIIESEARGEASGMMAAVIILMFVGVITVGVDLAAAGLSFALAAAQYGRVGERRLFKRGSRAWVFRSTDFGGRSRRSGSG